MRFNQMRTTIDGKNIFMNWIITTRKVPLSRKGQHTFKSYVIIANTRMERR